MAIEFKKATKESARLRMALTGVSGSGKTYTALRIACAMSDKVALLDTERGSATKYADDFDFFHADLGDFSVESYVGAIKAAEQSGVGVLVIDSLSHAWMGKGGILELHDVFANQKGSDSFRAWGKVNPKHLALLDAILSAKMHIIATIRSKAEYAISDDPNRPGKKKVEKVGMAPVQREGLEYEFDVFANIDQNNNLTIEKTRCSELKDKMFYQAGEDVAAILTNWLSVDGKPVVDQPKAGTPLQRIAINAKWSPEKTVTVQLLNALADEGFTQEDVAPALPEGVGRFSDATDDDRHVINERLAILLDSKREPSKLRTVATTGKLDGPQTTADLAARDAAA